MTVPNTIFSPTETLLTPRKTLHPMSYEWPKHLYARAGVTPGSGVACVAAEWMVRNITFNNRELLQRYQQRFGDTPVLDELWASLWADIIMSKQAGAFDDAIQRGELGPHMPLGILHRVPARYAVAITLLELTAAGILPPIS